MSGRLYPLHMHMSVWRTAHLPIGTGAGRCPLFFSLIGSMVLWLFLAARRHRAGPGTPQR